MRRNDAAISDEDVGKAVEVLAETIRCHNEHCIVRGGADELSVLRTRIAEDAEIIDALRDSLVELGIRFWTR